MKWFQLLAATVVSLIFVFIAVMIGAICVSLFMEKDFKNLSFVLCILTFLGVSGITGIVCAAEATK